MMNEAAIRESTTTEVMYMAVAMLVGYLVGILSVTIGGIPFALGTFGALIAIGGGGGSNSDEGPTGVFGGPASGAGS